MGACICIFSSHPPINKVLLWGAQEIWKDAAHIHMYNLLARMWAYVCVGKPPGWGRKLWQRFVLLILLLSCSFDLFDGFMSVRTWQLNRHFYGRQSPFHCYCKRQSGWDYGVFSTQGREKVTTPKSQTKHNFRDRIEGCCQPHQKSWATKHHTQKKVLSKLKKRNWI